MRGTITDLDRRQYPANRGTIEELLRADNLLWLDIEELGDDGADILRDVFALHPLAVGNAAKFDQRAKLEEYDDFAHLVVFGCTAIGQPLTEIHVFYADSFLITVHHGAYREFDGLVEHAPIKHHGSSASPRLIALHHLLDTLVESFVPVLSEFDDRIDALQEQILAGTTDRQLTELSDMKQWLVGARKVITPERDYFVKMADGAVDVLNIDANGQHYFNDLYDHVIRISELIDSYRDLLTDSMDVYLSVVSNRLNVIMKQLTIIATIFLPLSFLTGFFGQNFGWLTDRLGGFGTFFVFAIVADVVAVAGLMLWFRRKHWI